MGCRGDAIAHGLQALIVIAMLAGIVLAIATGNGWWLVLTLIAIALFWRP